MEVNEIKSIMITDYKKQIDSIFDKFKKGEIDLKYLISYINGLTSCYNSLRADIKNQGSISNNIEFIEYGANISINKPDWLKNELGIGYQLEENKCDFNFIFKCINPGKLKVTIRSVDFKDINNNPVPIPINFNKLIINYNTAINQDYLVCHDKPYIFERNCENQQIFYFDLKYKTVFDYFPQLKFEINDDFSENEIMEAFYKVNEYINAMMDLL